MDSIHSTNRVDIDAALDRVAAIQKELAALHAEQVRLIAAIVDDPREDVPAPIVEKGYLRDELRVLLGESAAVSNDRIETARLLVHRLPATLAALEAGELTLRHAHAVRDTVIGLSDADAARIEQSCVPFARGRDYTAFSRKLRRELLALPSRSREDHLAAALADRRVWSHPNSDSATATVGAVLPADGAQTLTTAIDTAAGEIPNDDPRSYDQRRADALVRIAQDWLDGIAATGRRLGPAVQVTVAASTLLCLDDQPADLDGHGPVPAALARAIAADPTGTWRRLVIDPRGRLLDYGRTTYRPPARLREFVIARDRECQFPGCHRHGRNCELDHLLAWSDGGPTNESNVICLCPRHHHLKHEAGWTVIRLHDGTLRWTSPDGRTYDNQPTAYPTDTSTQSSTESSTGDAPNDTPNDARTADPPNDPPVAA